MIPQFKATDKPYSGAAVLYMVNGSFMVFVEGNITGNIDAKEDAIPPIISKEEHMKGYMSLVNFLAKNKPIKPEI